MYQKIQAFKRQGYCRNEIASRLGIDPQTAAKYYLMDEKEFRVYQQKQMFRDKALQEHEKDILQVYKKNEFKAFYVCGV